MTRQGVNSLPMLLMIERTPGAAPLHRQIYRGLRTGILEGSLGSGIRLPGSRVLAKDLGVSRATVLSAYDQLTADGYVIGLAGGGTRVAHQVPRPRGNRTSKSNGDAPGSSGLSHLGSRMIAGYSGMSQPNLTDRPVPFALGEPALDVFPVSTWARLIARRWRETPRTMLAPDDGSGYAPLRKAIAEYVIAARAVRCTPDRIVITAGAQQGIDLAARLLLNPGDGVWVEEYGYPPARAVFTGVGAVPIGVPVDAEGLDVDRGVQLAPGARLAFVTPAFEAPLGVAMSLRRRIALLDWAHRTGAWIIEDDYNGELRYEGKMLAALQGLDHPGTDRVIYLRTFSRTLFPALRLGYAVLPPGLVEPFTRVRSLSDRHSPTSEQAVLADFIAGGHFARHIRTMRQLYSERQRAFLAHVTKELGSLLRIHPAPSGIHLVGWLPPGVDDRQVAACAARRGVIVEPLAHRRINPSGQPGLVLGYVAFQERDIRPALAELAVAIRAVSQRS